MKMKLFGGKFARSRVFAVISIVSVVLLIGLNLLITYLGLHGSAYIDMTPEGLYSLTPAMKSEMSFIDELPDDGRKVKITFCTDPDVLISSTTARVTYFMALKLASTFKNVEVETVNIAYNPTAVAKYKPTSLSKINASDIIVSYGDRYRVVGASTFWTTDSAGNLWSYNGEYKLASVVKSVTAVNRPVAYFTVDHGESYYDPAQPESEMSLENAYIYDLLGERGMDVKTIRLSEEEIPEDCVLLIINNPRTDFSVDEDRFDEFGYISESEKLDRYMVSRQGSVMVMRDYKESFPVLDAFLYEWGFDFSEALVSDEDNHVARPDGAHTDVIGEYNTDENSYGYAIYGDLAAMPSAPSTVFSNAGYISCSFQGATSVPEDGSLTTGRHFASLFNSYSTAAAHLSDGNGEYNKLWDKGALTLAATTTRRAIDSLTSEYSYSYLFCVNSPDFLKSEYLGNASFANYDVVSALVQNIARIDEYASLELGGTSLNSPNVGGKPLMDTDMSDTATLTYDADRQAYVVKHYALTSGAITAFTVVLMLIPVAVTVCGAVVCVRRRFL